MPFAWVDAARAGSAGEDGGREDDNGEKTRETRVPDDSREPHDRGHGISSAAKSPAKSPAIVVESRHVSDSIPCRRRAAGAAGADRRRERRAARRVDGDVGDGARLAARQGRRRPAPSRRSTRPATSGSRFAGESDRALLLGGHIDSVPNGGWLDGCLNVVAAVEVLRRVAEEGTPPLTVRVVNWADEEGARFGRSLFGSSAAGGSMADQDELRAAARRRRHRASGCARRARRRPRPRARRALAARERRRVPRAPHRAGAGARVARPAARRRPRHVRRRAPPHHVARPGGARRLDADGPAPRRARRRREARARAAADRGGSGGRGGLHVRRRGLQAGHRHLRRRDRGAAPRPAAPRRRRSSRGCSSSRSDASERFAREENIDVEWQRLWGIEPIPFDDAPARPRRGVDPRGARARRTASRPARSTTPPRSPAPESRP